LDERLNKSNQFTLKQHAERINQVDATIRDNVILKAEYIIGALDELGLGFAKDIADLIGMNKSTLSRWQTIGASSLLKNNQSKLPSSFGALYNITLLERAYESHFGNGAKRIQKLLDNGDISPTTPRSVIEILLVRQQTLINKKKSKETEKKIEALTSKVKINKPSTLSDFIKGSNLFHTIVIVPTKEQIKLWNKLDFPIEIGDSYPLQDIRKTTQTAPVYCYIIIERTKLSLGVKCFEGWGFSYKDYLPMDDKVVLIGTRGISKNIDSSVVITSIKDVCKYAEKLSTAPNILIGTDLDLDGWQSCNG
jgi:hypothetical protein